jgi:predicted DNA-binding transcriptional regulator AlpA
MAPRPSFMAAEPSPAVTTIFAAGTLLSQYLSPAQLAHQLGVCKRTLDRWHAARTGPPRVTIGRKPLYRREAVEQWLLRREKGFDEERRSGRSERGA